MSLLTWNKTRRGKAAFTMTEMLTAAAIATSVSAGAYVNVKNKAYQTQCQNNLRQAWVLLQMYEMTNGRFPNAAFFPSDARGDANSIVVLVPEAADLLQCPSAPEELKAKKLTFLWNDACSNKPSHAVKDADKTWLLIEINAVSREVPPPHTGGFNVLFADGTVQWHEKLPADLQAELDKKRAEAGK